MNAARSLKAKLEEAGKALVPLPGNLVDAVWGDGIPAPPATQLRIHALQWAGQSAADKLAAVRAKLEGARPVFSTSVWPDGMRKLPWQRSVLRLALRNHLLVYATHGRFAASLGFCWRFSVLER